MKIILTGSLGHIGKPLTKTLVQKGHAVTVISSKAEKQKEIEALGATAAIGSIEDADFLAATFAGADAVYTMVMGGNYFDPNFDLVAYCSGIAQNYVQAIRQSDVKRVVHLSSIGAHMDKNSGLILAHHNVEVIMDKLADVAITFMRPVGFYYNLFGFIPMIKNTGMIASNYGADDRLVWVSPIDIAAAVAEELEALLAAEGDVLTGGRKVRYVVSDELTGNETASILGAAIGKPDMKWILIPSEQMQAGLEANGMNPQIAAGMAEMFAAQHSGELTADLSRNKPAVLGKEKLTDFAKEFAAVYNQK
ncbi:NAD(P)H-binding protein [Mucilaginibacter sp.]|uniref:NAD(P)H-binding protein n=1 Tax=Mucilaginibacter sp. TaxID=1882438 RepID=UPI0028475954|nr:NAD(P)H-binding protein [Mucilaginibacter sp.]MDR3695228.1 NAD(P)H-binding protein [Mucilaginibacter sp.]